MREELRRTQVVEVERTRPITQPHEAPVPERIDAVTTTEQMSVMEHMDEPRYKTRLDQEGRRIMATMMIQGDRNEGDSSKSDEDH